MYRSLISIIVVCFFIIIALGSGGRKTYTPQYTYTTPEKEVSYVNNTNIYLVEYNPPNLVRTGNTILLKKTVYTYYYDDSYDYSGEIKLSNDYLAFNISLTQSSVGNNPYVFDFQIANNSDQVIKVKWDEVSYIDNDGVAHPVIKSGVRLMEKAQPTRNVVIPPQSKVDELIHPSDYIDYVEGKYGGWSSKPVLESLDDKERIKIFMPIDIGGTTTNYTFTFEARVKRIDSGEAQGTNIDSKKQCGPNTYRFYNAEKKSIECIDRDLGVRCKNNESLEFNFNTGPDPGYWFCPTGVSGTN